MVQGLMQALTKHQFSLPFSMPVLFFRPKLILFYKGQNFIIFAVLVEIAAKNCSIPFQRKILFYEGQNLNYVWCPLWKSQPRTALSHSSPPSYEDILSTVRTYMTSVMQPAKICLSTACT